MVGQALLGHLEMFAAVQDIVEERDAHGHVLACLRLVELGERKEVCEFASPVELVIPRGVLSLAKKRSDVCLLFGESLLENAHEPVVVIGMARRF